MSFAATTHGWYDTALLELVTIKSGQVDPRVSPYRDLPLIAPDHLASRTGRLIKQVSASAQGAISGKYLVRPGDVIYSKIRPYLQKAYRCDFEALCSADMYPLTPRRGVDSSFILHSLLGHDFTNFAVSVSARSGIPKINREELAEYRMWVPGGSEQRTIGQALDDADNLIAILERLVAKKRAIKQGMMQQLLTGRTRLAGFADEWTWRPFPELMFRVNAKKHQIPASSYSDVGRLPVVDQGQKPIIGYTDHMNAAFDPGDDGVVVFGDHTCITKFVDFKFAVGADGTQLVKAKPGNSTRFFAHALKAHPIASTGYNRHFKFLWEKLLPAPELAEQQAVADVLDDAGREIGALESRLAKARAIKLGMTQQLLTGRVRLPVEKAA